MKKPTIRIETSREHHRAKWWRLNVAKLSTDQLAALTGYSRRSIEWFELGCTPRGGKIKPNVWLRYKMACAGVMWVREMAAYDGEEFRWGS